MDRAEPLVIVGGGLAGTLAALALAKRRPEVPVLLIESGEAIGGNHTWSYFDGDLDAAGHALVAPLEPTRWPRHTIEFPSRRRIIGFGYNSVHSAALHRHARERLDVRLGETVVTIDPDGVTLASQERVAASGVIDARGPSGPMPGIELGWQTFVGLELEVPGHGLADPIIMDATVEQLGGYRFVYSLPFAADRLLVEDTYYTDGPGLDVPAVTGRARAYAAARGWDGRVVREETGVLPICLGGDPDIFWPADDPLPRLGLAGGFFHAMTGYSLPLAVANALALAELPEFDTASLARWTRRRFLDHWAASRFQRLLGRMLFRGARPTERVKVFEHFYRLPEETIARFYAGRLTLGDKARILTGKPPIPIGRAIKAMLS